MANSLQNVTVPKNQWIDLYALTGLAVGTRLVVENSGDVDVFLAVQAAQPPPDHNAYNIVKRPPSVTVQNSEGDAGAWAYSNGSTGKLSISSAAREGFTPIARSAVHDGFGNPITSYRGAVNVHIDELHGQVVNELFNQHPDITTTLVAASSAGDVSVVVASDAAFSVGDVVEIHDGNIETTFPIVTDKPGGDVLVLDRPLDFPYAIGDTVELVHTDLSTVAGTLAAPVAHHIRPQPGQVWFVNRIIIAMTHPSSGADDKFGDLPALTNGVVLRINKNGQFGSFTNWKTNADIRLDMYDVAYSDKAGGPGGFGTSGRGSFNRVGVLVELNGDNGDFMEVLVQDDVTGLDSFFINGQGYIEA